MPEPRQDLLRPLFRLGTPGDSRGVEFVPEVHVLRDGQAVDDVELLVHRGDAEPEGSDWVGDGDGLAAQEQLALGGLVCACEHLDERRLACAVLAEQAVDFAGEDVEVDAVERPSTWELLDDAAHLQEGGGTRCGVFVDHVSKATVTFVDGQAKVSCLLHN